MTELALACFHYRAKHRLTQKEMGEKCGLDRTVIIDVEKGRKISKMTEAKLQILFEEDRK